MANLSSGPLWRRTAGIITDFTTTIASFAGDVIVPIGRGLASSLGALGGQAKTALARQLDGGYRTEIAANSAERRNDAAIELENVSVAYGDRLALKGLSGQFAAASLTAVVGPNGAGKSSLLKALTGILPLQSGKLRSEAISQNRFAYLPQQVELNRDFPISVGELIALGGWRRFGSFQGPPDTLRDEVADAIEAVRLGGFLDRQIADLSAGEFQRALFARLLLQDPVVVLLDEPFAALDENTIEDLMGVVRRWHDEQRTVIAVLHDLDQVREHFPLTLLLARSCIAWGETDRVLVPENLVIARKILEKSHQLR
jgi:zinc/manganese transport system ATP-binding protein